jgi:integral membrane protein (TIGR01906 family)
MIDVRNLYLAVHGVKYAGIAVFLLLLFIVFRLSRKGMIRCLAKGYLIAAAICLALFLFLLFLIVRDFNGFWTNLHYLFFANELWLLDPKTDILIQMLPEQFFYDLVVKIVRLFIFETVVLAIMSGIALKNINKG